MFKSSFPGKWGVEDLIVFSLYLSGKDKKQGLDFEDLTNECFKNFPQVFCLKKYPVWPDTRKLDRPLRDLRRKGLIKNDIKWRFFLTAKGEKIAREASKLLSQKKLFNF